MNSSNVKSRFNRFSDHTIFSGLLILFTFFQISAAYAQVPVELNKFLSSPESKTLGMDRSYLLGNHTIAYLSSTSVNFSKEELPTKLDVRDGGFGRISEVKSILGDVEILQIIVSDEGEKRQVIPTSVIEQIPSLRVVIILSEVPISAQEVQGLTVNFQGSSVKILYLFSQPA